MAEYTAFAQQTVTNGNNVIFTDTPVCATRCIVHREGSGIVTLRGLTSGQCRARFRVTFGGNIAVPADGTAGAISVAIALAGEALPATMAIVTPAAVSQYNNVSTDTFVDVPAGCCTTVSIKNTSGVDIDVQNANLIVTRVA